MENSANNDTLKEYEKFLEESRKNNLNNQDKIVMTISSALLGILLTMSDKFSFGCESILLKILLFTNSATLILSLISFLIANQSVEYKIRYLYEQNNECKIRCLENATKYINLTYIITTCVSVVLLAFVIGIKL